MVQISLQNSGGKVIFLGGSMETSLGTNGSKSTLVTFKSLKSVKLLTFSTMVLRELKHAKNPNSIHKLCIFRKIKSFNSGTW